MPKTIIGTRRRNRKPSVSSIAPNAAKTTSPSRSSVSSRAPNAAKVTALDDDIYYNRYAENRYKKHVQKGRKKQYAR